MFAAVSPVTLFVIRLLVTLLQNMSLATAQAAAAAAAAALMPPPPPHSGAPPHATTGHTGTGAPTATATKWWQDPALAFGPAVDPELIARRTAGCATTHISGREGAEVQSAPAGKRGAPAASSPSAARRARLYGEGRMHLKRKAAVAVDADEASSGTSGHALGSHEAAEGSPHGSAAKVGGCVGKPACMVLWM
jgi:hypothetical protein